MLRTADYIAQTLSRHTKNCYMVTGGGAMHLNDAFGQSGMNVVYCHHEQSCSMAAEADARISGQFAVVNVTTGPGGINALNGVYGAWTDSIPMVVISGQVKSNTYRGSYDIRGLRQLGEQEVDIVEMVRGITKYAFCITDPATVRYHLERAIFEATTGRMGPVWLDIPVDIQAAMVNVDALEKFVPSQSEKTEFLTIKPDTVERIISMIHSSNRPVIIASTGIRLAGAMDELEETVNLLDIPIVTSCNHDVFDNFHPNYIGQQGTVGDRAGNIAVQNADLLLILGSRMPIRQVSYNWENFAKNAYKIQVDIDEVEMQKPTLKIDLPVVADCKVFLNELNHALRHLKTVYKPNNRWKEWCQEKRQRYPIVTPRQKDPTKPLNPYHFLFELQRKLSAQDVTVCANGMAGVATYQTARLHKGQQLFTNIGCASMGYDLPAAIGAAVADPARRVICIAGDGSIMMNLQELQTIKTLDLNVKIFVLNNNGYLSIKSTQKNFFKRLYGSTPESGIEFPDFVKVGIAFGIPSFTIKEFDFDKALDQYLTMKGPVLIDVIVDSEQPFEPKLSSKVMPDGKIVSASLEDMAPFLPSEEMETNYFRD